MELKGVDRRYLRGLGHSLPAVVLVGKEGLSEAVLASVGDAHRGAELIKLRVLDTCPQGRKDIARQLDESSDSAVVQVLGRTLLLYRRDPDEPKISLPSHPQ